MTVCALFDTDRTLVDISRLVERAFGEATFTHVGKRFKFSDLTPEQATGVHMERLYLMWMENVVEKEDLRTAELWPSVKADYERELLKLLYLPRVHGHSYRCTGAVPFLKFLKRNSIPCGVFSGAQKKVHEATLHATGLEAYFDARVSADDHLSDGKKLDTRAKLIECCYAKLRIKYPSIIPEETVVFGDTPKDITSAREYGAKSVAICASSLFTREQLVKSNPTGVYASFKHFRRIYADLFEEHKS